MSRSFAILSLICALFAVASAADGCAYPVTKWTTANYKLGASTAPVLSKCPSGFTGAVTDPSAVDHSVLTQTIVQKVWPNIAGDDADVYTCPEGLRWIQFSQMTACYSNTARNPRFAKVNGLATFVCKNQARMRNITMATDVTYNKFDVNK